MPFAARLIQAERAFVRVAGKVLRGNVVPSTVDAPLEKRPHRLGAVRVDVAVADIFAVAVPDARPLIFLEAGLAFVLIGVDCRTEFDMAADLAVKRRPIRAGDRLGDRFSAALAHTKDRLFANWATTELFPLVCVFVLLQPPDIGFVDFDDAVELTHIATTGFPQPSENEPSGFLCDADFLGKLHGRYALPRRDDDVHGVNPFVKRDVGSLEDGPGAHRKFLATVTADIVAEPLALPRRDPFVAAAMRASHLPVPAPTLKILAGSLLIGEHLKQLKSADCGLAHGACSLPSHYTW